MIASKGLSDSNTSLFVAIVIAIKEGKKATLFVFPISFLYSQLEDKSHLSIHQPLIGHKAREMDEKDETTKSKLTSQPAKDSSLYEWISNFFGPLYMIYVLFSLGIYSAFRTQFSKPSIRVFNPLRWKELVFVNGIGPILSGLNQHFSVIKGPLLGGAYGKVLEVGAGSGENVGYYHNEKIEQLFCLEPCVPLQIHLKEAIAKKGLEEKSTIIPFGLESKHALNKLGVTTSSFDTVVLVQVMCTIQNPKAHLEYLQSLLKPGGQILLFEHVASKHPVARASQNLWNVGWSFVFGGCCLNRDSAEWVREIGGWSEVVIQRPSQEKCSQMYPHAIARFVKSI